MASRAVVRGAPALFPQEQAWKRALGSALGQRWVPFGGALAGARCLGGGQQEQQADKAPPAQETATSFHVGPGSTLHVQLRNPASRLVAGLGGHESLELSSGHPASLRVHHDPTGAHGGHAPSVVVEESEDSPPQVLKVSGPSRFFSIDATTAGGGVVVQLVHEGSLRLSTAGGPISVTKAKAIDVRLDSGGGPIDGSVSGVDVALASGGGTIALKRLEGRRVALESGGGPVAIVAAFGDELRISSGGGALALGSLNCQEGRAQLHSGGGDVEVGSLDGSVAVTSGGGAVTLQLNDRAGQVSVDSGGGDVRLFVSPFLRGRLRVLRCDSLEAGAGSGRLATDGAVGGDSASASSSEGARQGNRVAQPPSAEVTVDAGAGGRICVEERSWTEAMRQRLGGRPQ